MDTDTIVQAEIRDNILDPGDDALELDAPDSDVETGDTSAITVISVTKNELSPPTSRHNGHPESTESHSSSKNERKTRASGSTTGSKGDAKNKDRPTNRRRQWGTGGRQTRDVIGISTDSLEKLVPTLTTEPADISNRSTTAPSTASQSGSEVTNTAPTDGKAGEPDNTQVELEVEAFVDNIDSEGTHQGSTTTMKSESPAKSTLEHCNPSNSEAAPLGPVPILSGSSKSSPEQDNSSKTVSPHKRKGPKETKAVGYLVEAPERVEPSQPAKHKPTNIIYIRSLVRPFTVEQLRQMISDNFGPVDDLWLDRIKSSSLVRMETIAAAEKCREGLDGSRWPSMNPRVLRCDFGNEALFDWMKMNGASGDLAPPRHLVLGLPEAVTGDGPPSDGKASKSVSRSEPIHKRSSGTKDLRNRLDVDTRQKEGSPRRKSPVQQDVPDPKKNEEEPAKLLDDLFRKTDSTPCIYWLPLTKEEAQKQSEERLRAFMAKRSVYVRTNRPGQRATRSPFTSPGPNEATAQKSTDRHDQSSSTAKAMQPDRPDESPVSKEMSSKEMVIEPKSKTQLTDNAERARKKSPGPSTSDARSDKRDKRPAETRKRDRSPFTPIKTQSGTEQKTGADKSSHQTTASSSLTKRPRSRSPSPRRSQPSRTARPRRSSSRSSTGRGGTRRRTTGSSSRRDRKSPPSSSKYTRARSRSVERRAISPPTHRSYGRSHR